MAYEFKLPDIGEGVVEGEIVRWLVNEGDVITQDQPMVEVMTDKATVEIPAPRPGTVLSRHYAEGQLCPVGKVLITIDDGGASASAQTAAPRKRRNSVSGSEAPAPVAAALPAVPASPAAAEAPAVQVLATPATRKLARTLGVDLSHINGSGPAGRITHDDVQAASDAPAPVNRAPLRAVAAAGDVRVPFRGLRRKIAERMTLAKQKAAHFTYVEEVDAHALVTLRARANDRLSAQGLKLSYLPFIVKATVEALKCFPQLNATLDEAASEIIQRRSYHIGMAAATAEGLVVPVIHNADQRSLLDLAREIDRLAAVTRAGRATREDLTGSTFTITSLGAQGGLLATPVINFPEVAILGVHKIAKRAVVVGDKIEIREMMNLSISVDHRLVDGHEAAAFVNMIKESLETPGLLFLDSV